MSNYLERDGEYLNGKAHYHVERVYVRGVGMRRIYKYTFLSDDFPSLLNAFGSGKRVTCTALADLFYNDCRRIAESLSNPIAIDSLTKAELETAHWLTTLAPEIIAACEKATYEVRRNIMYGILLTLLFIQVSDEETAPENAATYLSAYKEYPDLSFIDAGDGYGYFHKRGESIRTYLPPAYTPEPEKIGLLVENIDNNPLVKGVMEFLQSRYKACVLHEKWWTALDEAQLQQALHKISKPSFCLQGKLSDIILKYEESAVSGKRHFEGVKLKFSLENAESFKFQEKKTEFELNLSQLELNLPYHFQTYMTQVDGRKIIYGNDMKTMLEMIEETFSIYIQPVQPTSDRNYYNIVVHIPGLAVPFHDNAKHISEYLKVPVVNKIVQK